MKFDILPEAHRKLGLGTDLVALRRSTTTDGEGLFELRAVALCPGAVSHVHRSGFTAVVAPLTDEDSQIVVTLAGG